ncbi:protein rep [Synechococcus sp. R6-10]|uniref:protein rep n=1 Tax=Synechococcus sp. R6-10 TaxID=2291956 RepID=UPI0039C20389
MPKPPTRQEICTTPAVGNRVAEVGAHAPTLGRPIEEFVGRSPTRFRLQRYAASLTDHGGLSSCFWRRLLPSNSVEVRGRVRADGGADRARLGGLVVCGSHLCPVCGPRLAKTRREEVARVIAWATGQGLQPVFLTLTTSHQAGDNLAELLDRQRQALRSWRQHRAYREAAKSFAGTISAFETTYGKHGWHPHTHILFFVRAPSVGKALRRVRALRQAWRASAAGKSLRVGRAGFQAQAGEQASRYLTKWDIAAEVAGACSKHGRYGALTPFALLLRAYEGDAESASLWAEYAAAMKRRSVLRFSQGLRAAAGLGDVSDVDAATPRAADDESIVALIAPHVWESAKAAGLDRTALLSAACAEGGAGVRRYLEALLGLNAPPPSGQVGSVSEEAWSAASPVFRAPRDSLLSRLSLSLSRRRARLRPPLRGLPWPVGPGPPLGVVFRRLPEEDASALLSLDALRSSLARVGPRSRALG